MFHVITGNIWYIEHTQFEKRKKESNTNNSLHCVLQA